MNYTVIEITSGNPEESVKKLNNYLSDGWTVVRVDELSSCLLYLLERPK